MGTSLPEPLELVWQFKPVSSAKAGVETLSDGRKKFWIKHDVLKNVTPQMLAWWFGHMEGDVQIQGRRFPRYRVWHPLDHLYARYVRRAPDGSRGPGAVLRRPSEPEPASLTEPTSLEMEEKRAMRGSGTVSRSTPYTGADRESFEHITNACNDDRREQQTFMPK